MFAVIFVVHPREGHMDEYLGLARQLKPILETIDGFIDNERFSSETVDGDILSLSTWRDEKSLIRWRTQAEHHGVQEKGRSDVFKDYHLRVGEITADSHPPIGGAIDEKRFDETVIAQAKFCTITEVMPADDVALIGLGAELPAHLGLNFDSPGIIDHVAFKGITIPGKRVLLIDWESAQAASAWTPELFAGVASLRHRHVRIIRNYGMRERREAPQYYPDAPN
jgi:heme-degrading monooxygenase HmoA